MVEAVPVPSSVIASYLQVSLAAVYSGKSQRSAGAVVISATSGGACAVPAGRELGSHLGYAQRRHVEKDTAINGAAESSLDPTAALRLEKVII